MWKNLIWQRYLSGVFRLALKKGFEPFNNGVTGWLLHRNNQVIDLISLFSTLENC